MTYLEELKNKRMETVANNNIDANHKKDILNLIDLYIMEAKNGHSNRKAQRLR